MKKNRNFNLKILLMVLFGFYTPMSTSMYWEDAEPKEMSWFESPTTEQEKILEYMVRIFQRLSCNAKTVMGDYIEQYPKDSEDSEGCVKNLEIQSKLLTEVIEELKKKGNENTKSLYRRVLGIYPFLHPDVSEISKDTILVVLNEMLLPKITIAIMQAITDLHMKNMDRLEELAVQQKGDLTEAQKTTTTAEEKKLKGKQKDALRLQCRLLAITQDYYSKIEEKTQSTFCDNYVKKLCEDTKHLLEMIVMDSVSRSSDGSYEYNNKSRTLNLKLLSSITNNFLLFQKIKAEEKKRLLFQTIKAEEEKLLKEEEKLLKKEQEKANKKKRKKEKKKKKPFMQELSEDSTEYSKELNEIIATLEKQRIEQNKIIAALQRKNTEQFEKIAALEKQRIEQNKIIAALEKKKTKQFE